MAKQQGKKIKKNFKRVFVVDDHPIMRRGLAQIINQEKDIIVCGESEDAHQALKAIGSLKPDIVIVDLSLKGPNGIELTKSIKTQYPMLPVLVLSMFDESLYAERALRAGARGYVMKQEASETVVMALRKVLDKEFYLSEKMAGRMLGKLVEGRPIYAKNPPIESLTNRELEVFRLIGRGRTTRQIAEELYLSVKTIESYRAHIKDKLSLANATELVQHAIQWVFSENHI